MGLRRALRAERNDPRNDGMDTEAIDTLIGHLKQDYTQAELSTAERAMLDYAAKLTRTPQDMTRVDVDTLRGHGYNDRMIHDLCAITAYFAFVNRIADGLGVELEERFR